VVDYTNAPSDERLFHHEVREGHEDRITDGTSNSKKKFSSFVLFVCFVVMSIFLFWLRLRRARIFVVNEIKVIWLGYRKEA
jgi:hypothetical protein